MFALQVDSEVIYAYSLQAYIQSSLTGWRRMVLLVSKMFYVSFLGISCLNCIHVNGLLKRLALPHFYCHPIIRSRKSLYQLAVRLVNDSSLGLHIRSLLVYRHPQFQYFFPDMLMGHNTDHRMADSSAMMNIFSRAPRLTRVSGAGLNNNTPYPTLFFCESLLSWDAFCVLADTAGSSLVEFEGLYISDTGRISAPYPFGSFTALRKLFWNCTAAFDAGEDVGLRECFPHLESLTVSAYHPSFLGLLMDME
jgi:hypothetical protein